MCLGGSFQPQLVDCLLFINQKPEYSFFSPHMKVNHLKDFLTFTKNDNNDPKNILAFLGPAI